MGQRGNYVDKIEPKFIKDPGMDEYNRELRKNARFAHNKKFKNSLKKK